MWPVMFAVGGNVKPPGSVGPPTVRNTSNLTMTLRLSKHQNLLKLPWSRSALITMRWWRLSIMLFTFVFVYLILNNESVRWKTSLGIDNTSQACDGNRGDYRFELQRSGRAKTSCSPLKCWGNCHSQQVKLSVLLHVWREGSYFKPV